MRMRRRCGKLYSGNGIMVMPWYSKWQYQCSSGSSQVRPKLNPQFLLLCAEFGSHCTGTLSWDNGGIRRTQPCKKSPLTKTSKFFYSTPPLNHTNNVIKVATKQKQYRGSEERNNETEVSKSIQKKQKVCNCNFAAK